MVNPDTGSIRPNQVKPVDIARYTRKTFLCLLLLCFGSSSYANSSANPFTILLEHARQGNVDAMFEVGNYYQSGEYTDQDWQESIGWYEKAIALNHTRAMLYLGRLLLSGVDTLKADIPRAIELIQQAATAGDAEAQFQLGQLFENGAAIRQDLPSAIRWYRAANLQKYPGARSALKRSIAAFKNRATH